MTRELFSPLAFIVGIALSGSALAQTIACTMTQRSNPNYVAPDVTLTLRDYGEVAVQDAVITATGRKMVQGTITREDTNRISLFWEVRNVVADPRETRRLKPILQVRLTIQKKDGSAAMTVVDAATNKFSYRGTGTCALDG